jgi:3-oxoacyl-[acyl-carrier protein] reductase
MAADRVALVTGAARGIGLAVAGDLLRAGHRVVLLDLDEGATQRAAAGLDMEGERTLAVQADVRSPDQIDAALAAVRDRWGMPDVLVNNAARTVPRPVLEIELDEWDDVLATNLRSCLVLSQRCAPAMREAGWGRIVNMASFAGQQGGAVAGAHYAASKAGMIVLTKILAGELARDGVTVNAVAPAAIRTPVMDGMDTDRIAAVERMIPVGRLGRSDEVASTVTYLCSDAAAFMTGTTIDVNGGLHMR